MPGISCKSQAEHVRAALCSAAGWCAERSRVAQRLSLTGRARRSLGLAVTVVVNLALAALNLYQRRQIEQQQRQGGCAGASLLVAGL